MITLSPMAESLEPEEFEVLTRALEALEAGGAIVKPGDLLSPGDAAEVIGVDRTTVSRWIRDGYMPPPLQVVMKVPIWTRPVIEAFAAAHRARADSAGRRPVSTR